MRAKSAMTATTGQLLLPPPAPVVLTFPPQTPTTSTASHIEPIAAPPYNGRDVNQVGWGRPRVIGLAEIADDGTEGFLSWPRAAESRRSHSSGWRGIRRNTRGSVGNPRTAPAPPTSGGVPSVWRIPLPS